MKAIRILLVDDFEVVRHGLRYMLAPEEDMDVVGDCDAEEVSSKIARLYPDIVLTGMPGIIRSLKRNLDYGGVIVLAESLDYRAEALEAGVASYLFKDVTRVELVEAIRQVYLNRPLVVKEAVELVIPPPDNTAQLLRFMCQPREVLHDNSAMREHSKKQERMFGISGNNKGLMCPFKGVVCQEGYCTECQICLDWLKLKGKVKV